MDFEQLGIQTLFKEYQKATGGKNPIGLTVPTGFPCGIQSWEEVAKVYKECIKQEITWEELLNYESPPEGTII